MGVGQNCTVDRRHVKKCSKCEKKKCCLDCNHVNFGTSVSRDENDRERPVPVLQYRKRKWSGQNFPVFMKLIKSNTVKNDYKINCK